jgi:hypothetical protein
MTRRVTASDSSDLFFMTFLFVFTLDLLGEVCDYAPLEVKRRNIWWRNRSPNCRRARSTCLC